MSRSHLSVPLLLRLGGRLRCAPSLWTWRLGSVSGRPGLPARLSVSVADDRSISLRVILLHGRRPDSRSSKNLGFYLDLQKQSYVEIAISINLLILLLS